MTTPPFPDPRPATPGSPRAQVRRIRREAQRSQENVKMSEGVSSIVGWHDEAAMALCAIRYCIGRRSYIVSDGVKWARRYGAQYLNVRQVLIRDLTEAVERMERVPGLTGGLLGDPCDEREWRAVLAELKAMDQPCAVPGERERRGG